MKRKQQKPVDIYAPMRLPPRDHPDFEHALASQFFEKAAIALSDGFKQGMRDAYENISRKGRRR